jgi:hypothetical protein
MVNVYQIFLSDAVFPEYYRPVASHLMCFMDVPWHIEPEFIDNNIQDLPSIVPNLGFFTLHIESAK